MKYVRLAFAILAAIWTIGVAAGVVKHLIENPSRRGLMGVVGGFAAIAFCVAITAWAFEGTLTTRSDK